MARRSVPPAAPTAGLDFTFCMRRLCADVAVRLPELAHVDMARVALRICQTRKPVAHGMYASLTPLRFAGGQRETQRRGRTWAIEPVFDDAGREMLYLLSFYLPRFCDQPLAEKVATVVHELWHIGPAFDGDLRRLPGRCYAHGASERDFHAEMRSAAGRYLAQSPPRELYEFLEHDFRTLRRRHGSVFGLRIPTPRIVPVAAAKA